VAEREPVIARRLEADLLSWIDDSGAAVPPPNPVAQPYDDLAGYFLHGQIHPPPITPTD
jgi:hypothetical protein